MACKAALDSLACVLQVLGLGLASTNAWTYEPARSQKQYLRRSPIPRGECLACSGRLTTRRFSRSVGLVQSVAYRPGSGARRSGGADALVVAGHAPQRGPIGLWRLHRVQAASACQDHLVNMPPGGLLNP